MSTSPLMSARSQAASPFTDEGIPGSEGARPLYLDLDPDPVFALFHEPAAPGCETAVIICPPFGWDDMCSYRSRWEWAEDLARRGHPVLRFDLPGSGDSGGSPHGPGRLDAWTNAVIAAARWLRAQSGCPRLAAIGIGLGGLLACRAEAEGAQIDELVLWATHSRGRTHLRELQAFGRLEASQLAEAAARISPAASASVAGAPPLPKESLEAAGYLMDAATAEAIRAVDLAALPFEPGPRRVLMIERGDIDVDQRLRDALEQAGAAVTVVAGPGYSKMMNEPGLSRTPVEVISRVASWLAAPASPRREGRTEAPAHCVGPTSSRAAALPDGVCETPLVLPHPDGRLVGILSKPAGECADVTAVLLNAGPQRRTGPNRMWVETARRWAAQGVPTLRLDFAGIGDSDGDGSRFGDVAASYSPALLGQVRSALDHLESQGLAPRFLLVGLCSGAYWAFQAALEDERVVRALMLNPRALVWDAEAQVQRELRTKLRRVVRPSSWRKLVQDDATLRRQLGFMRRFAGSASRAPARVAERRRGDEGHGERIASRLDALASRETPALMFFSGQEPILQELERNGLMSQLDRWPNLDVQALAGLPETHTLRPIWIQRHVHELLDRALLEQLALDSDNATVKRLVQQRATVA